MRCIGLLNLAAGLLPVEKAVHSVEIFAKTDQSAQDRSVFRPTSVPVN